MSAPTCPTCGQPWPDDAPAKPRPKRVQSTYRMYRAHSTDDLPDAVAEYVERHGCQPARIVVRAAPDDLADVAGVPVTVDACTTPGVALLEVRP